MDASRFVERKARRLATKKEPEDETLLRQRRRRTTHYSL